jgi:hypothetical protein
MSFWQKIHARRAKDAALEVQAGVRRNVPQAYSPADIRRLEEERVPWLKRKRRR